ncbi:hypothetical protein L0F63_005772 [Massospora cicadina]|nr:hypothetical protein L0F63_005772 [Massospora cicadina]
MAGGSDTELSSNPVYRSVGIGLAVLSGALIGISFILKKKGLISSRSEDGDDNHDYLKSTMWWLGMLLMALGEVTNFVAYALAPAVLVTPLGALSVVVSAILSSIFLKERLNFHGKVACFVCLLGVVIIVLHAPEQDVPDEIDRFMWLALAPGFLVYTAFIILGSVLLVWRVAPKYGKRHPLVYITICSFIGSLSVCTLQALGGAIIRTINGDNQFSHWFIYALIAFVVVTIITQINYLNKALNAFVTAEVTPVYYVVFTTATLVSSAILYQGFKASPVAIVTLVFAFFIICSGVVILQTSRMYEALKSAEGTTGPPNEKQSDPAVQESEVVPEATVLEMPTSTSNVSFNPSVVNQVRKPEVDLAATQPLLILLKARRHPPYLSSNLRKDSYQSSIQSSSSSIVTAIHRIGVAMNPEARDHLKPRTIFTNDQLEETCSHPLSTSIRPLPPNLNLDWERRNSSGPISRCTPQPTPRDFVLVTEGDLVPPRPIFRTASSPLIGDSASRGCQTPSDPSPRSKAPCPQPFDFAAITEEPEPSAPPNPTPTYPHDHPSSHRSRSP